MPTQTATPKPTTKPTDLPRWIAFPPGPAKRKFVRTFSSALTASARRLTSMKRKGSTPVRSWQEDAWDAYDQVGELRFLATTLAGRLAQAGLYVGRYTEQGEEPETVTDPNVTTILDAIGDSDSARAQLIYRLAVNLFVAGEGWLVGIPRDLIEGNRAEPSEVIPPRGLADDYEWRMLSVSELSSTQADEVELKLGDQEGETIKANPDDLMLVRIWRPHPRRSWEADSPTRSSLPVLRELIGLTKHIGAQIDSRLAGAGLLIAPTSAQQSLSQVRGDEEGTVGEADEEGPDPLTEALIEAMMTPLNDRESASAVVPLVVTVPDESVDAFKYLTFATPFDEHSETLREEAIRRLALGQDAPPELLLGTAGMNHWGAWLVQEDVISTHIEPPLALICDALTTAYLHPALVESGMSVEEARKYVIWYDVGNLAVRPNRSGEAMSLHQAGVLSDEALRQASGFEETDAPGSGVLADADPIVAMALGMVASNPSLAYQPGIPALVDQLREVIEGEDEGEEPSPPSPVEEEETPATGPTDQSPDSGGGPPTEPGSAPVG